MPVLSRATRAVRMMWSPGGSVCGCADKGVVRGGRQLPMPQRNEIDVPVAESRSELNQISIAIAGRLHAVGCLRLLARDLDDVALVRFHLASDLRVRPHVHAVVCVLHDLGIESGTNQAVECVLCVVHGTWLRAVQDSLAAAPQHRNDTHDEDDDQYKDEPDEKSRPHAVLSPGSEHV